MTTTEPNPPEPTLGDVDRALRELLARGVTVESIRWVLDREHAPDTPVTAVPVNDLDVRLDVIAGTIVDKAGQVDGEWLDGSWVRARLDDAVALAAGSGPTPPYVHRILDALLLDADFLDFRGFPVPHDVQVRLTGAARAGAIRPMRS